MSISVNDLLQRPWTKVQAATGDATVTGAIRIMAANINHTAAATLIMYNALTQAGTDLIKIGCAANDMGWVDFGPNGVKFGTGLSLTLSAGVAQVYYIAE